MFQQIEQIETSVRNKERGKNKKGGRGEEGGTRRLELHLDLTRDI